MAEVASVIPIFTGNSSFSDLPAGKGVSYPHPPDRYAIASDTRVEPRERLRTLFSRIYCLTMESLIDLLAEGVRSSITNNRMYKTKNMA